MVAAFSGGQVDWLGQGLAATWRVVCIHQMKRVFSRNGLA